MTLAEFLLSDTRNAYINHPKWSTLYVRKTPVRLQVGREIIQCDRCITLARIEAKRSGRGTFTALIEDLTAQGYTIYVESVMTKRFRDALVRHGFQQVNQGTGFHYAINF